MNPTHRVTATGELVFPEGYDPAEIELLPEGYWEAAELADAKAAKWLAIKAEREARARVAPTTYGPFDCDETGRSNLLGQLQAFDLLGDAVPVPIRWKLNDNSFVELDRTQFTDACLQVLAHIRTTYETSFTLEGEIDASTTVQDVQAVTWPEGA